MVCLDWMELLFQLNVITISTPMHMNRSLQCAVEICVCVKSMSVFRKYSVGGVSLHPTWVPLVATASAEDQIDFHLLLMTGFKRMTAMKHCSAIAKSHT